MLLIPESNEQYRVTIDEKLFTKNQIFKQYNKISVTSYSNCSLAKIAALLQSITSSNGKAHPFESKTGIHPPCKASRNLKVPNRRPLGMRQKEELRRSNW